MKFVKYKIEENVKNYIKKVGTGPKGNEDLTNEEAYFVMDNLLNHNISDVEKASFLIGWRLKPETNEEYQGALSAIYKKTRMSRLKNTFELGFPFDGKNNSPYLFPLIAKILKTKDINLVVTGDERIPAKEGVTVKMIHDRIGHTPLADSYHYFDRKVYLPELSQLSVMRNQMGLRTALNTLEKFSKVAGSDFGASGVFHKPYVEKYSNIFSDQLKSFLLLGGNEGTPEIVKKSKCWIVKDRLHEEFIIDPEEFGVSTLYFEEDLNLDKHIELLSNPDDNMWNMACLNAAIYFKVINSSTSIVENYDFFKQSKKDYLTGTSL